MNTKKWVLSLIVVLLLAGGAGAYYALRTDPNLAHALNLQKQMRSEDLSREDRGKLWGEMRTAMDSLSDEQRQKLRQEMFRNDPRMIREMQRINNFFALSPKEQTKALDKAIDEEVKRRKEWEKRRKEREKERQQQQANGQSGGGNGGGGNGGNGGGGRGNGGGGNGGGGNGGGAGGDRGQQRRLAMDNTSAQQRAQMSGYFRMMTDRMQQRGIPSTGGGFGGGFGGGGRRGG
jgi:hypothetical protein